MAVALLRNAWTFSLLILFTSVQAFVSNSMVCERQQSSRLFARKEEEPSPTTSRSIGNVVQGLHGGKYQFGSAGINYEGQQFAEMGYSSGLIEQDNYEDEPMPNWALKLQQSVPPNNDKLKNYPQLELNTNGMVTTTAQVQNQERSWEKYYAFIVGDDKDVTSLITVEPRVGMLAPRGGVNEFSDRAQLQLTITANAGQPLASNGNCWLLVGTEEESWFYKLMICSTS
jgi:hypothetical protein